MASPRYLQRVLEEASRAAGTATQRDQNKCVNLKPTGHSLSANVTARLWICLPVRCTGDAALLRLAARWHLRITANCKAKV